MTTRHHVLTFHFLLSSIVSFEEGLLTSNDVLCRGAPDKGGMRLDCLVLISPSTRL